MGRFIVISVLVALLLHGTCLAQYAPQAGLTGTTAIAGSSTSFVGWATQCHIVRGFQNISNPALGYASFGDSSLAIGQSDLSVVSLGDSGVATLTFARPIFNGSGPDFAVFENGFANPQNGNEAFLELAFVEVSSNGVNFFRFPSRSLTQDTAQIALGYIDARDLNDLAGKYIGGYGTPFDLQELAGTPGLDINSITHVRIIDAVGSIGAHAQLDASGHRVNDPFPTPYASSGFDLDALGVMHQIATLTPATRLIPLTLSPNPFTSVLSLRMVVPSSYQATVSDPLGRVVQHFSFTTSIDMDLKGLPSGVYFLTVYNNEAQQWVERIVKQ